MPPRQSFSKRWNLHTLWYTNCMLESSMVEKNCDVAFVQMPNKRNLPKMFLVNAIWMVQSSSMNQGKS